MLFDAKKWLSLLTNLQFGKVFAINLPSRPDKRDNIVLGSSVCDFLVDWIDGVLPEEISSKSYPYVRLEYSRFVAMNSLIVTQI